MRIKPPAWVTDKASRALMTALKGDARFVGGCVRDTILKRPIGDIDLATPLFPEEIMRRLGAAKIKAVPTGIAHGTITAVTDKRPYEITTLRRDVETFGRHARVAFSADWKEDSARRDFTMNALYMSGEGEVFDYHDGIKDLRAGKVRFVGDPKTRIREDVLRLLRFYRFHAWYGRGEADAAARAGCRASTPLLPTLSGERVQTELLKLLTAKDPLPSLAMMLEDGVMQRILPKTRNLEVLARLIKLEPKPDALRRLAALVASADEGDALARKLKFSNADRERLIALAETVPMTSDAAEQRRLLHRLGRELYGDRVLLTAAIADDAANVKKLLAAAAKWKPIAFPLRGADIAAAGVPEGPAIGKLLAEIAAWWEAGDFKATRKQCLSELQRRLAETAAPA
ncbi:MAG TPA: CCA tRNA nucleotidyltransferase [Stellaceae bacterium]|nr:CCA tRNA nucleotidyltransferase [Stellaceae bacterium]